jgi:signal transduction histidine kinase
MSDVDVENEVPPKSLSNNRDLAFLRLEHLYEISRCLATYDGFDETILEVLAIVARTFPLLSAVLVEQRGDATKTIIWPTTGLSEEQIKRALDHVRRYFAYLANMTPSQLANLQSQLPITYHLRGEEFAAKINSEHEDSYLIFPLVVGNSPIFGALQFEGTSPLAERDIKFVDALSNLIAVAYERFRIANEVRKMQDGKIAEGTRRLSLSESEVTTLERERELRERFVASLTHDLRNPLGAAKMNAQMILRELGKVDVCQRLAGKIVGNIDRVDFMIQDLLDANKIYADQKISIEVEEVDLQNLVHQTLEELAASLGDWFVIEAEGNLRGHWSAKGLRRVVENLCTNAIKYGSPNSPITVSLQDRGDEVTIGVHNSGPVIPAAEKAGIFDLFQRARSAEASGKMGWGIGLTIVKGLVEAHGGRVEVQDLNQGTEFKVTLPRDARPHQNR